MQSKALDLSKRTLSPYTMPVFAQRLLRFFVNYCMSSISVIPIYKVMTYLVLVAFSLARHAYFAFACCFLVILSGFLVWCLLLVYFRGVE